MSYEDKILDKFADMIMPPGTIIAYQGIEAPEGFIVYDHIKIYEDEFPRLYPVLAANPNFKKGADSDGRKWVELPEIEDLCIQMTTDTSQVGKTLEAQLPNITGRFWDLATVLTNRMGTATGCFTCPTNENSAISNANVTTTQSSGDGIDFSASKSSGTYFGTKLQPAALQVLPCIKI